MQLKDILRPVSGFFFIQPFVIMWYMLNSDNPSQEYISTGWLFQVYMTVLFIPYYAWYEKIWKNDTQKSHNDTQKS